MQDTQTMPPRNDIDAAIEQHEQMLAALKTARQAATAEANVNRLLSEKAAELSRTRETLATVQAEIEGAKTEAAEIVEKASAQAAELYAQAQGELFRAQAQALKTIEQANKEASAIRSATNAQMAEFAQAAERAREAAHAELAQLQAQIEAAKQ